LGSLKGAHLSRPAPFWSRFACVVLALVLTGCASTTIKSDYAREQRWASEFESGIVVGDALRLQQSNGHKFVAIWAKKPEQTKAIIFVHGIGVHPDHGLTGRMRNDLHDAGFATLSLQAPILDPASITDAAPYKELMADAAERIDLAVSYATARGAKHVYLVGHTLGSWMINEYFARKPARGLVAWASLGYTGNFSSFGAHTLATLDVYPERGSQWTRTGAPQRLALAKSTNAASEQLYLTGTDLSFAGQEKPLIQAIEQFFKRF
jgi:hypothetical protein